MLLLLFLKNRRFQNAQGRCWRGQYNRGNWRIYQTTKMTSETKYRITISSLYKPLLSKMSALDHVIHHL